MGAAVVQSHLASALEQIEQTILQAGDVPIELRVWASRVLWHMQQAGQWATVLQRFGHTRAVDLESGEPVTVQLVIGGMHHPVRLVAVCGRYLCVRVEVDNSLFPAPRWHGWFDGRSGAWLADGGQPEAWSDRITLEQASLPAEIRAEVDAA